MVVARASLRPTVFSVLMEYRKLDRLGATGQCAGAGAGADVAPELAGEPDDERGTLDYFILRWEQSYQTLKEDPHFWFLLARFFLSYEVNILAGLAFERMLSLGTGNICHLAESHRFFQMLDGGPMASMLADEIAGKTIIRPDYTVQRFKAPVHREGTPRY